MPFFQSYPVAYETLYRGRPFTCATTGEVFDAIPPPVAVILDVRLLYSLIPGHRFIEPLQHCSLPQLQATRAISGAAVPVIAMLILPSSYMICYFGPESLGGVGDFGKKEAARIGVPLDELRNKVLTSNSCSMVINQLIEL